MTSRTKLVAVTHVSNILGQMNPIAEFARFVHGRGARICVDAVAYAPRILQTQLSKTNAQIAELGAFRQTLESNIARMRGLIEEIRKG